VDYQDSVVLSPTRHLVTTLLAASMIAPAASSAPVQWEAGSGGNDHLYDVVLLPDLVTWDDANAAALALPGDWHLATITSAPEAAFIEGLLDSSEFTDCVSGTLAGTICTGLWLGATSSTVGSNDWQWVSGEAFSFTDWGQAEPFGNGDRIRLDWFLSNGVLAWNDARNVMNPAHGYVVELVPEPSTVFLVAAGIVAATRRRFIQKPAVR
jgi:hypothetical protein